MPKANKEAKKAKCKISSELFDMDEINSTGYSTYHFNRFQKMRNYAKSKLNRRFTMRDYREINGFPTPSRKVLSDEDVQMLEVWASSKAL